LGVTNEVNDGDIYITDIEKKKLSSCENGEKRVRFSGSKQPLSTEVSFDIIVTTSALSSIGHRYWLSDHPVDSVANYTP